MKSACAVIARTQIPNCISVADDAITLGSIGGLESPLSMGNINLYCEYLDKLLILMIIGQITYLDDHQHAGIEFHTQLQESIWILLGGVCESLWTLLHSVCVKLLKVYES